MQARYNNTRSLTGGLLELSMFLRPHSKPGTVREYEERETEPGVNETVKQMDDGPHSG